MESRSLNLSRLFLDSSFLIALHVPNDDFHRRAVELSFAINDNAIALTTTRAVLLEVGNALSRKQHRKSAAHTLTELENDASLGIVEVSQDLYLDALDLFEKHTDKEWGIVDCISFLVMRQFKLEAALTTDRHFVQAGFRALLREE